MNKKTLNNIKRIVPVALDLIRCKFDFDKWSIRHHTKLWVMDMYPTPHELMIKLNGFWYNIDKNLPMIDQCNDYTGLKHITKDDIVIDIGANIGGFSLPASKVAKKVIAIEPILADKLKENIKVNNIKNITVIEKGLGNGEVHEVSWMDQTIKVQTTTLSDIIREYGGTILKCDCEGGEWYIKPSELDQINHIDIEFHYWGMYNKNLVDYIKTEFCTESCHWHSPTTEIFSGYKG